ncbi:hypothetical protein C9J85_00205 [Haloferax sp. wsp5]|nr:hypothetical protein C9J85_00205 [Haloferax sp. wsp5]
MAEQKSGGDSKAERVARTRHVLFSTLADDSVRIVFTSHEGSFSSRSRGSTIRSVQEGRVDAYKRGVVSQLRYDAALRSYHGSSQPAESGGL